MKTRRRELMIMNLQDILQEVKVGRAKLPVSRVRQLKKQLKRLLDLRLEEEPLPDPMSENHLV